MAAGASVAIVPLIALPLLAALRVAMRDARRPGTGEVAAAVALAALAAVEASHGAVPRLSATFAAAVAIAWALDGYAPAPRVRTAWLAGLALGVAAGTAVAAWQGVVLDVRASAWPWSGHPNLFAHALLAIVLLGSTRGGPLPLRAAVLMLALPALAFSGSRVALLAWLPAGVLTAPRRVRPLAILTLALLLATTALLVPRVRSLSTAAEAALRGGLEPLPNLLVATDALSGPAWTRVGVTVTPAGDDSSGARVPAADSTDDEATFEEASFPSPWKLETTGAAPRAGLRQLVVLDPGDTVTLAAELRPGEPDTGHGLWLVRQRGTRPVHLAEARLDPAGRPITRELGDLRTVRAEATPSADGWTRLELVVRYDGAASEALRVGPIVTAGVPGRVLEVRGLRLVDGVGAASYHAVSVEEREVWTAARTALQRVEIWRVAVQGVAARPWLGHGPDAFTAWYRSHAPADAAQRRPPAHAHSLPLELSFSYGVVGLAAVAVAIGAVARSAWRRRDGLALAGVAVIVAMNLFDATLTFSGVLFPVAALLAFRPARPRAPR